MFGDGILDHGVIFSELVSLVLSLCLVLTNLCFVKLSQRLVNYVCPTTLVFVFADSCSLSFAFSLPAFNSWHLLFVLKFLFLTTPLSLSPHVVSSSRCLLSEMSCPLFPKVRQLVPDFFQFWFVLWHLASLSQCLARV